MEEASAFAPEFTPRPAFHPCEVYELLSEHTTSIEEKRDSKRIQQKSASKVGFLKDWQKQNIEITESKSGTESVSIKVTANVGF